MQLGEKWLRSWVNPDLSIESICDQLTNLGLEVDDVIENKPSFSGVLVGEIKQVKQHPNADRLTICEVDGGNGLVDVVCGAPNVRVGMKAPFAPPGAQLAGVGKIKATKLRGTLSNGMLCSSDELGISDDHSGIMDLDDTLAIGTQLTELFELEDRSIVFDLTPNRGDCFCLRGVARELAVINEFDFADYEQNTIPSSCDSRVEIELHDPMGCPRYLGRVIENVNLANPTPPLIVSRLTHAGLRSINPIVDVLNYVMLELGQPMHAFDLDHVAQGIGVRRARNGEKLVLLDSEEIELDEDVLLITSADKPVAVAGVVGGLASGVTENTTSVLLECAYFSPSAIFGTARKYGLNTDAATRYERGVDFQLQHRAMERATELLLEITGGSAGPVCEAEDTAELPSNVTVELSKRRLAQAIGETIPDATVVNIFARLGLQPKTTADGWTVTQPSHRFDIAIEEDLVEEVCRVYGYDRVVTRVPHTDLELRQASSRAGDAADLRAALVRLGYYEVVTYSFIDHAQNARYAPAQTYPTLQNPMSADRSVMRGSLVPGLLSVLKHNVARQIESVRVFEFGQCFNELSEGLNQEHRIAGVSTGKRYPESWSNDDSDVDFYDVKGDVHQLLPAMSARLERSTREFLHPGQSAEVILGNKPVGFYGRLHPDLEKELDCSSPVVVFELKAEVLRSVTVPQYSPVSAYPSVRRDLALLVDEKLDAFAIENVARESLGDLLVEFTVFDVYQGDGVAEGKKSLGVGMRLQEQHKTLDLEEANSHIERLINTLGSKLGVQLRDA